MPSQNFGRYELLERISAGGMAEVFRAKDKERGGIVAVKRILPHVAGDDEFIHMLEDEARIASQLEHPHIARTLDCGQVGGQYFIAFEFVDGKTIKAIFDRSVQKGDKPPLSHVVYIFARIGEGLAYAHARKDAAGAPVSIVHRDVSPQNIVISFNGDVKLIDFGIAKAKGKLSRTEAGAIKGKYGYMSPEQIQGSLVDQRTDVFSLGICMWELLTLQRLYDAPNEIMVLQQIRTSVIPPPSTLNPAVAPELDRIVCKALAKNVDERYRSAKELYRDLNLLSKDTNDVATRGQIAQYMRRTFPEVTPPRELSINEGGVEGAGDDVSTAVGGSPLLRASARSGRKSEEPVAMSADNKGGSDLDVFEGLGKKSNARPSAMPASAPRGNGPSAPPPSMPPSIRNSEPPPGTLRGLNFPPAAAPSSSAPPTMRTPPPPPGRGALPVVVPPPRSQSVPPGQSSPPLRTAPQEAKRGAKLDMDWDDEDEATHIFDKEASKSDPPPRPLPSSALPAAPAARGSAPGKRTLIGIPSPALQAPPPPPPPPPAPPGLGGPQSMRSSVPAPPSSVGGAFARASSIPSAAPGPVSAPPPPPPTIDPRPSQLPPPPAANNPFVSTHRSSAPAPQMPPQTSTVPLPMPARPARSSQMPDMPPPPMMNRMEATALVRPPEASRTGFIIGICTSVVVVAAALFYLVPRKGTVRIAATDAKGDIDHMEVYVDGKKTDCATSPCVEQASTGAHIVKVAAEGYGPVPEQTVDVSAGSEATATFALGAGGEHGTGDHGFPEGGTGVKVSGNQHDVKLYVDDKEIGPLPAEAHDLAPGSHRIRIAGGDRYAPVEKNVTVAKDEMQDLGSQTLKVLKGKATITLSTPGAKVYIVSGTDRRELPQLPIGVDIDTSKQWSLLASKPGFTDFNQPISFDDGQAEKSFDVSLAPKQAVSTTPYTPPSTPYTPPTPHPQPPAPSHPAPSGNGDTSASSGSSSGSGTSSGSASSGDGAFLNINSIPASSIVLDGKPIGNTPKLKYGVSPGQHTVLFVNADQGFKKTVTVNVGAGETKPAIGRGE